MKLLKLAQKAMLPAQGNLYELSGITKSTDEEIEPLIYAQRLPEYENGWINLSDWRSEHKWDKAVGLYLIIREVVHTGHWADVICKIGISSRPLMRYSSIQSHNSDKLELYSVLWYEDREGARYRELRMHEELEKYKINGEWFRAPQEELAWVWHQASDPFTDKELFMKTWYPYIFTPDWRTSKYYE